MKWNHSVIYEPNYLLSRGSSQYNRLGCKLDDRNSILGRGWNSLFLSAASRPTVGSTQTHIQWVPRIQQTGREAYSPPSSEEVKIRGALPTLPNTSSRHDT